MLEVRFQFLWTSSVIPWAHLGPDCFIFLHNHHHPLSQRLPGENKLELQTIHRFGTMAFSWLKAPTSAFTFYLRHY